MNICAADELARLDDDGAPPAVIPPSGRDGQGRHVIPPAGAGPVTASQADMIPAAQAALASS